MRNTLILLGAASVLAFAGAAQAQVLGGGVGGGLGTPVGGVTGGATGQITGPGVPTEVVTDTARRGTDTGRRIAKRGRDAAASTIERARGAADDATDASARAAGAIRAGTTVRDDRGATIGKVISADGSGYVQIQTRSGVVTLPQAALRMNGGVAVSSRSEAEIRASGSARVR